MAFSPDGHHFGYAVMLTNGVALVVLDYPSRKRICELGGHVRVPDDKRGWDWVFTSDGRGLIGSDRQFSGGLCLWDLTRRSEPHEFPGHSETISALAISPDGRMLATGAAYTETGIKLWELPSFRLLGELFGHRRWITALKFSSDSQKLASAGADQTMRFWDLPTRTSRRLIEGLPSDVSRTVGMSASASSSRGALGG